MTDPQTLVGFVLAGVIVPMMVLALLGRRRAGDGQQPAAATGGREHTDRNTA